MVFIKEVRMRHLIYALQAELGYSPDEATGSYGNGTTNATYPVSEGDSGNYVRIVQYGLFVNGYYQSGAGDGIFRVIWVAKF